MPRTYSTAIKAKAVDDLQSGKKTSKEIRTELKITSGMLSRWVAKHGENKKSEPSEPDAPTQETPERTSTRRKRADDDVKARAVAEYRKGERSAKEIGAEFGVSDATIYAWANQLKKKEKKGNAVGVPAQLTPSAAGMDASLYMLKKAQRNICKVTCPCGCGHTFYTKPPTMTETLVIMAAHLAAGEEP